MNTSSTPSLAAPGILAPGRERALLRLLALTQFTVIMDFMVMMPLGPQIMRSFGIGPANFALAVSAYAICSGLSGFFAATYIDRFDRAPDAGRVCGVCPVQPRLCRGTDLSVADPGARLCR